MQQRKLSESAPIVVIVCGLIAACFFVVRASISPVGAQTAASVRESSAPSASTASSTPPFSTTPCATSSSAQSATAAPSAAAPPSTPATSVDPGKAAESSTSSPASAGTAAAPPPLYQHPMGWWGGGKVVSLTFDDGPGPQTSQVLDILDKYGIKATFCMIGKQVSPYEAVAQRIISSGDQLCNHSYSHNEKMATWTEPAVEAEMQKASAAITKYAGASPKFFRTPAGEFSKAIKDSCYSEKLTPLSWAVDSKDWTKPGVQAIVHNVLSAGSPGAIILMHDAGGDRSQTLAALPTIIATLQSQGYTFTTPAAA